MVEIYNVAVEDVQVTVREDIHSITVEGIHSREDTHSVAVYIR